MSSQVYTRKEVCLVYFKIVSSNSKARSLFSTKIIALGATPTSSHFNFCKVVSIKAVGVITDQTSSLIGLVSLVAPIIAGGNTCIVLASESKPLCAITFAEVLNSSDVPDGVVNILTGSQEEMIEPLTTHMDVNAMSYSGISKNFEKQLKESSALNLKRVSIYSKDWIKSDNQDLYMIADFQEIKTTWHPIENIGGSSSFY